LRNLCGCVVGLGVLAVGLASRANADLLHTYGASLGQEVSNLVAVSMSKLLPLLPSGYTIVPASTLSLGRPDQGIVVIANVRVFDLTVDGRNRRERPKVAVDVGVLVAEPAEATVAGLNIPGAFHLYALAIYSDDVPYAESLLRAHMPVRFASKIQYQRDMDDTSGVGNLFVSVSNPHSAFFLLTRGLATHPPRARSTRSSGTTAASGRTAAKVKQHSTSATNPSDKAPL
jgi:hypothetical protein